MEFASETDPTFRTNGAGKELGACSACYTEISDQTPFGWCPVCLLARVSPALSRSAGCELEATDLDHEFSGRYEFRGFIERGATGAVYHAVEVDGKREVAIKLLAEELVATESVRSKFEAEATTMGQLQHPNIVSILDSGVTALGLPYIVMELVEGCDLRALSSERQMQTDEVLDIFGQVCDAIAHAHKAGILHLDIKPSNILIDDCGNVRVTDFGISRIGAPVGATIRTIGAGEGWSFGYSSPEQIQGGRVDERADIYALGAVLYELLTGEIPVGSWKRPGEILATSQVFDRIIERALQRDPQLRYNSVQDLYTDLVGALADMSLAKAAPARLRPRRQTTLILGSFAIAGVTALFWPGARWSKSRGGENPKEPSNIGSRAFEPARGPALRKGPEVAVVADDEIVDSLHIKYSLSEDGTALVTGYVGVREVVEIPAEVDGSRVTGIADFAFQSNLQLREVRIAEGIETLGSFAFKWCSQLTDVKLPSTLKVIGPWAFDSCVNLNQPVIPAGVTRIAEGAFADCPKIRTFEPPPALRFLERYSFQNCIEIRQVKIPRSIERMEGGVFAGCIGVQEFQIEPNHPTFTLVDGVIFDRSLTKLVHFPPGRRGSYIVPASIRTIGQRSFYGCFDLEAVKLPDQLKTIETQSFIQCNSLDSIEIPASVDLVMDGAFSNCQRLKTVKIMGTDTIVDPEQAEKLGNKLVLPTR
jgi:hypothetical protein